MYINGKVITPTEGLLTSMTLWTTLDYSKQHIDYSQ